MARPGLLGPVEAVDVQLHGSLGAVQSRLDAHKACGGVAVWRLQDDSSKSFVHSSFREQDWVAMRQQHVRVSRCQSVGMCLVAADQPNTL